MNEVLSHDIDLFIEQNKENILRDIARLVKINSVQGEKKPGAPFGEGVAQALKLGLEISRELGLEAVNCEDMIGYASVGEGDKYLATITHLDIVPTGDGWTSDPFEMRQREGWVIGRGVQDDKGPSVLCLYALKYLKEKNIPLRYQVRALLGVNEETGMEDAEYYLEHYPAPVFCFSPDADFPLINGEKGIYHGRIIANFPCENIIDIKGGFAANAVPDKAQAIVKCRSELQDGENIKVKKLEDGVWQLTSSGVSGHASTPEGTVNAIGVLLSYILENGIAGETEQEFFRLLMLMHDSYDGKLLGIAADDGLFTPLTVVGGVIGIEDGRMFQTVDSRYPTNTSGGKIAAHINELAGELAHCTVDTDAKPFYVGLDNPALKVCIGAYNEVTAENAQPYTIGGGTYSRHFPNAVSFGPEFADRPRPDFAGFIHGVDEAASVEQLLQALKIYIVALINLQEVDF